MRDPSASDEMLDDIMRSAEMETQTAEIDDVREQLEELQTELRTESAEIVVAVAEMNALSQRLWSRAAALKMLAESKR